ncbi:MAG TPA: ABC transporter substrate-binding protein [Candidatus Paceibacterota bacterium]|nr:ABC transporter substrate-binding protein [Candidatus Paceibacterota bacterium]
MKKVIWVVVAVLVIWGIVAATKNSNKVKETGPIKIGFIAPLTGDAAAYGEVVKNGTMLAEKEINARGGINGRPVEVIYDDGKCNGKDATSATQKLVNVEKVKFLLVGECSGGLLAIASFLNQSKVLSLAAIATNPAVADAGDYIFRNAPNDNNRGTALANYAKQNYKKVAIMTEQTDYAQGLRTAFKTQAAANGLEVVADEEFTSDTKDYRSMITKVKATNPDVIFMNPQTGAAFVRLATQARELGLKQSLIGSEFNGPEVAAAGAIIEGTMISVAPGLTADGKGKAFAEAYKKEFGKEPAYAYYAGAAYDNLMLLADGIAKEGEDADEVRDFLYNLPSYTGTIGSYSFDEKGELVGINFVFQKFEGGKFVEVK